MSKSRLGRGLASLIGDEQQLSPNTSKPVSFKSDKPGKKKKEKKPKAEVHSLSIEGEQKILGLEEISPSDLNPRRDFLEADLVELSNSIKTKGLVQPIVVRPNHTLNGGYEIVAGERRWRAAQRAGLHQVPVIVRDLTDRQLLEIAIIENVQRADLNPVEEALGYKELIDRYDYTQDDLAKIIGKSRSHLANILRLLKLPESVQQYLRERKLSAGHARALIGFDNAKALADRIVAEGMSVREIESLLHDDRAQNEQAGKKLGSLAKKLTKDADTLQFERELSDALGLKVQIKSGKKEKGKLSIQFSNYEQLDDLRRRLIGS